MTARILHLLNSYLPPTETFIWQYLRQARDFSPLILADKYENLDRFPLMGGDAPRLDLPVLRPAWSRAWAVLAGGYAPVNYAGLDAALQGRDVVLAHAHQGFRACVTQSLLHRRNLPFVVSFYGSDMSRRDLLRRARSGYAEVFRRAGALLAEGPKARQRLLGLGAPEAKVRLMRIAIDLGDYAFRERSWDGRRSLRLIFVGRLVEKKGLEFGLQALARLQERQGSPEVSLTVVGDGPLRGVLQGQVRDFGLGRQVRFVGTLSLPQMREAMAEHDALLAPSCTAANGDAEGGAPTVLLEAQACGLPVIATTHDDIPFVTLPDRSALLVPERDPEALGQALTAWVERHAEWAAMGRAGRNHVAAHHDARQAILEMEKVYRGVLGS